MDYFYSITGSSTFFSWAIEDSFSCPDEEAAGGIEVSSLGAAFLRISAIYDGSSSLGNDFGIILSIICSYKFGRFLLGYSG